MLLAAGAGRRYGRPKALVVDDGVPWVLRTLTEMRSAGCDPLLVVVGAAAEQVCQLLPDDVLVVGNPDWPEGLGSSLRAGLRVAAGLDDAVRAVLVMLVDLPGVGAGQLRRLIATGVSEDVLAQAVYDGQPGHPVLLGRAHWAGVAAVAAGDTGARAYFRTHRAARVPLGTAVEGADRDRPEPPA